MAEIRTREPYRRIDSTALTLPDGLSLDLWRQVGVWLGKVGLLKEWHLGDLLNALPSGASPVDEAKALSVSHDKARDAQWMARNFRPERRHANLSYATHREVIRHPDDEQQNSLLEWMELRGDDGKRHTIKQLRERIENLLASGTPDEDEDDYDDDDETEETPRKPKKAPPLGEIDGPPTGPGVPEGPYAPLYEVEDAPEDEPEDRPPPR
jgi:hypothetical protein